MSRASESRAGEMATPLIFVDVGNTSIAAGIFPPSTVPRWWREPQQSWRWRSVDEIEWDAFQSEPQTWVVAAVSRHVNQQLKEAVAQRRPQDAWRVLESKDFPIETVVFKKSKVGADRLAAVLAADALRDRARPAIVVDAGSAVNVELLDAEGVYHGGAILPGMAMAAAALATNTDLLPTVSPADQPPRAVGRDTNEAIRSGLFWGSWGAIQELAKQFQKQHGSPEVPPHLMLTGGGVLWGGLRDDFELHPHLVLIGIALAWHRQYSKDSQHGQHGQHGHPIEMRSDRLNCDGPPRSP